MNHRSISDIEAGFAEHDEDFEAFMPHQMKVLEEWDDQGREGAHLVHYPTGTGKTKIMLAMVAMAGYGQVLLVAPPITHPKWIKEGKMVGLRVTAISHMTFRMKSTLLSRVMPLIVDEFHLLGGHTGLGWRKLDRYAAGSQAPVVLGSATPNYNDAERCYCLVHILNPFDNRGGYDTWIYKHCITKANRFSSIPEVLGFEKFKDAAEFLSAQPKVSYLPDIAPDILKDWPVPYLALPSEFYDLNMDRSKDRVMSSMMEIRKSESRLKILDEDNRLALPVAEQLGVLDEQLGSPQLIIFAARKTVAKAIAAEFEALLEDDPEYASYSYIDGDTTPKAKGEALQAFLSGEARILIGTASLATGTDGIDKICHHMIIVDDTDDDSLRRQLVGRILPRGIVTPEDYLGRIAFRFIY